MRTRITSTHRIFLVLLALVSMILAGCGKPMADKLVVYCYDSFASDWGLGPAVIPAFEKATGIKVELVAAGDAGQALARVIDERARPLADVLIGVDNHILPKALEAKVFESYRPSGWEMVPEGFVLDEAWRITPFDWGSFAIIWDKAKLENPPRSLEELTRPEYARKLIIMDPRTSTPGYGFLAWTKAVYGDGMAEYWKRLKPSILTMSPGWDTGYGLFTAGEAPLVVSYTTSPAYHAEYEEPGRYEALIFPEGHPVQIEGAAIVRGSKRRAAARAFLDFMLSEAFQKEVPLTNFMYPILEDTTLPASFEYAPRPLVDLRIAPEKLVGAEAAALDALR